MFLLRLWAKSAVKFLAFWNLGLKLEILTYILYREAAENNLNVDDLMDVNNKQNKSRDARFVMAIFGKGSMKNQGMGFQIF